VPLRFLREVVSPTLRPLQNHLTAYFFSSMLFLQLQKTKSQGSFSLKQSGISANLNRRQRGKFDTQKNDQEHDGMSGQRWCAGSMRRWRRRRRAGRRAIAGGQHGGRLRAMARGRHV
jgi:hypothetical protein